jgi:hypothetical protein
VRKSRSISSHVHRFRVDSILPNKSTYSTHLLLEGKVWSSGVAFWQKSHRKKDKHWKLQMNLYKSASFEPFQVFWGRRLTVGCPVVVSPLPREWSCLYRRWQHQISFPEFKK